MLTQYWATIMWLYNILLRRFWVLTQLSLETYLIAFHTPYCFKHCLPLKSWQKLKLWFWELSLNQSILSISLKACHPNLSLTALNQQHISTFHHYQSLMLMQSSFHPVSPLKDINFFPSFWHRLAFSIHYYSIQSKRCSNDEQIPYVWCNADARYQDQSLTDN